MFDAVTSGKKGPKRADIPQLPIAHVRTLPPGSHATSGHAQWYILYHYYCKKKAREPVAHAQNIIPIT
jgi:hypothetical protein